MAVLRALARQLRRAAMTTSRPLLPPPPQLLLRAPPPQQHRRQHRHLTSSTASASTPSSSAPHASSGARVTPPPPMTPPPTRPTGEFTLRDFPLQRGGVLRRATLSYATYGAPGAPCILHPTSFDARHEDLEYAIGPGRTLDTDKYFVVVPVRTSALLCGWMRGVHAGRGGRESGGVRARARSWGVCGVPRFWRATSACPSRAPSRGAPCACPPRARHTTPPATRPPQNMLGNGLSTSPSTLSANDPASAPSAPFPLITAADNVRLQHALLTQHLGVSCVALAYGYSMGAMQALTWASLYPSAVQRVLASCGTASCHAYNALFLEGLLAILDVVPTGGDDAGAADVAAAAAVEARALRAFGRVYAGWGLTQEWYEKAMWAQHGDYTSLDDFLTRSWEAWTVNAHAGNLRAMLNTWRASALSGAFDARSGELDAAAEASALGRISARVVYMPGAGDRYFPMGTIAAEAALVGRDVAGGAPGATLVPLSAAWGHRAGDPHRAGQEGDAALMRRTVTELLAAPPGGG
jgi:homoserine O-acetyltransferase